MKREIKIGHIFIGENEKDNMIVSEDKINEYIRHSKVCISYDDRMKLLNGTADDYLVYEIYCYILNIEHKSRDFYGNMLLYGDYLESLICKHGNIVMTSTYKEEYSLDNLRSNTGVNRTDSSIKIAIPPREISVSDYQKNELINIKKEYSGQTKFSVYSYSNEIDEKLGYSEKIPTNKFFNSLENVSMQQKIKTMINRK